jgi:hypothetical protein
MVSGRGESNVCLYAEELIVEHLLLEIETYLLLQKIKAYHNYLCTFRRYVNAIDTFLHIPPQPKKQRSITPSTAAQKLSHLMQEPRQQRPQSEGLHCGESIEREDGIAYVSE